MNLLKTWSALDDGLKKYFLISMLFIFGLNLYNSIFFLYPLSLGLNFFETMTIIFALGNAIMIIANVPAGIIADKYSVKLCIVLAILFYSLSSFFRGFAGFFAHPITYFIIGAIFVSLADSMLFGAHEKYLYSFRKKTKNMADANIFSANNFLMYGARAIGTLAGGVIVYFTSMKWSFILSGIVILAAFILSLKYIKEPAYKKSNHRTFQIYKEGFLFAAKHKNTFYLIFGWGLVSLGILASRSVFQPIMKNMGFEVQKYAILFGVIFFIQMISSAFGSAGIAYADRKLKLSLATLLVGISIGLLLFSMTLISSIILFSFILWTFSLGEGGILTQKTILMNRFIEKEHIRATVNSISSLVSAIFLVSFIPIIGKITDKLGINANIYISSSLILVGAIILYVPHFKGDRKNNLKK